MDKTRTWEGREISGASLYQAIKLPYGNTGETGWRVDGQNHWLGVFSNKDTALYQIDKSRGSKGIIKFNQELFTFLDHPHASPTNNRSERPLRP
jgi:hypothetical protein